jgi:Cd2+/Zn2+-exporting ATPase
VYVVLDKSYVGHLVIADEIKAEAAEAIADLRAAGVQRVVMLTGDNEAVARSVAEVVKVDLWYAGLLPEDKVRIVEQLSKELPKGQRLAFVGDGINDAPVLMRADVGFAMGALGSDAAIEAADVVLMDDKVNGIGSAIRVAKHTRSVVMQNISLALLVKFAFLALGAVGFATMWEAVIADVGVSLLAVLNSTRTLRYSRRIGDGPK